MTAWPIESRSDRSVSSTLFAEHGPFENDALALALGRARPDGNLLSAANRSRQRPCRARKPCLARNLKIACLNHFVVITSRQRLVDFQIDRVGDEFDRSIGHRKVCTTAVLAAEVLKVTDRIVGHMVGHADDTSLRRVGFRDHALPNDSTEVTRAFAKHQRRTEPVNGIAKSMSTIAVEQAVSRIGRVM